MSTYTIEKVSCITCSGLKDVGDFYKEPRNTNGRQSICKDCVKKVSEASYSRNKEKRNLQSKQWRESNHVRSNAIANKSREKYRDRAEASRIMYEYGITFADYDEMLARQGGMCAICSKECRTGRKLCIDHNHETGKVRGLLCRACNSAIGLLKEDAKVLNNAIKYLS